MTSSLKPSIAMNNSSSPFESLVWFQLYSWSVLGTAISVLGLIFNGLSVVVVLQPQMMSSTSVYLTALAIFDSFVLLSLVLFMSLPVVYEATGRMEWYYRLYSSIHPVAYPLALTSQTGSIYTTLALTIERCVAVCRPLAAAKVCTVSRAKKAVSLVAVLSVLFNVPRLLEYHLIEVWDDRTNASVTTYAYTSIGQSTYFRYIYFIGCHVNVMTIFPFIALLVLNVLLVRAVRTSRQDPIRKLSAGQRREQTLTRMLIAEVGAFLFCQSLSVVDNVLMAVLSDERIRDPVFVRLSCVSGLLVIVNSASNFGLYCLFGKKFRQALEHFLLRHGGRFFPWRRRKKSGEGGGGRGVMRSASLLLLQWSSSSSSSRQTGRWRAELVVDCGSSSKRAQLLFRSRDREAKRHRPGGDRPVVSNSEGETTTMTPFVTSS